LKINQLKESITEDVLQKVLDTVRMEMSSSTITKRMDKSKVNDTTSTK